MSVEGTPRVVGIDLGTTNCSIAACHASGVTMLEIDGHRSMPSYVAFTDSTYLVGREARAQVHMNPANTIRDAKRLIGRDFDDKEVREDLINLRWPFLVQANEAGRPQYSVRCLGEEMKVMPEMISQLLLTKMKETAEDYFGGPLDGAVITVPAYFNDAQRQATKIAARQANIKVMPGGMINEPTAAALAYAKQFACDGERTALIFDLGGGTFDVSVVSIDGLVVEVKATTGDNHLGGEDFTGNVVKYFLKQIEERFGIKLQDPNLYRSSPYDSTGALAGAVQRTMLRLKNAAEDIKCALSSTNAAGKTIDYLWPQSTQFRAIMEREVFDEINEPLFQACLNCTSRALQQAKMSQHQVDKVVLVGGSTRVPRIKELLAAVFGPDKICDGVNPDEVVAYGAGVHAGSLVGLEDSMLMDVTNHSFGVAVKGDVLSVIFPRNNEVGATKERAFSTAQNNQQDLRFDIYEGDNPQASKNRLLDSFTLSGIPALPAGEANVVVKFRVDYDGTLSVTADDHSQGGVGGKGYRKVLRVSRKNDEITIRATQDMAEQTQKLAAGRHRTASGSGPEVDIVARSY